MVSRLFQLIDVEFLNGSNDRIRLPALTDHIRFLADQHEFGRNDMTPFNPTAIQKLAILEFVLRTQVVLTQYFGIRLELRGIDGFVSNAVEDLVSGPVRVVSRSAYPTGTNPPIAF